MAGTAFYYLLAILSGASAAQPSDAVYLSDQPHRILYKQQGWGQLGVDECAHPLHQTGSPLAIGAKTYAKGLGHHAPGEMIVQLGGEFSTFESDVGVQAQTACAGSVEFKVFVDDAQKFASGVMKSDTPARHISIPVEGAMELRLVVTDAGDGIDCDLANWADARLIRSASPRMAPAGTVLDVAPFAEVMTCDPARMDGARASRVEEYRADDVFLETPLMANAGGRFSVPGGRSGACIGLRWLERRIIREVGIDFDGAIPDAAGVKVQCWAGGSLWQGKWHAVDGPIRKTDGGFSCLLDWSKAPEANGATRKIRWIVPVDGGIIVKRLAATTITLLDTADVRITMDHPGSGQQGIVRVYNGSIVQESDSGSTSYERRWPLDQSFALKVRYTRPRPWKTDRTLLRFQLPDSSFAVAVDDVLSRGGVYVRGAGLFVSRGDMNRDLDGYLAANKAKKTVLQRVREMPDQTFAQAIEHVHNPKQDVRPMLLSLAYDNHKFIVERDGAIKFASDFGKANEFVSRPQDPAAQVTPKFGSGRELKITRRLEEGWMPAQVIDAEVEGVVYRQRAYVIPSEPPRPGAWLDPKPLCVVEYSVVKAPNTGSEAPAIELTFFGDVSKQARAKTTIWSASYNNRLLAQVEGYDARMNMKEGDGTLRFVFGSFGTGPIVRLYLPGYSVPAGGDGPFGGAVADPFERFKQYWQEIMAAAPQIELPDPLLTNLIRASQVHCLIAARNEEEGKRVAPWIASMSYGPLESESNSIIRGMDYWGHHEFARRSLDFFMSKYSPEGMLTTGYTLMGTGWHLWTLGEHYSLTWDKAWLEANAAKVEKVCDWIGRQRAKTQIEFSGGRPPEYGLLPPGIMADWNAFAYYFCLNGYYYKGLQETAAALAAIGNGRAGQFLESAKSLRDDIFRAYHWTQRQMPVFPLRDGTSVMGYPSQLTAPGPTNHFFPGEDANRSWCYDVELGAHQLVPQGVLDPRSRDVTDMMDHMEDVQFLSDGWFDYPADRNEKDWFNLGGFAKVQPYYCRNMEIYALRDDVKPFIRSYFNTIPSLLNKEVLSFNEHFAGVAAWNKTHETGYFLYYSRLMLVQERGDELWLMPFVTNHWLEDGKRISVKNAPTFFGPVSYEVTSHVAQGRIEASVTWPARTRPKSIALRVRHPDGKAIRQVSIEGANGSKPSFHMDDKDHEVIHLEETPPTARVTIEY